MSAGATREAKAKAAHAMDVEIGRQLIAVKQGNIITRGWIGTPNCGWIVVNKRLESESFVFLELRIGQHGLGLDRVDRDLTILLQTLGKASF